MSDIENIEKYSNLQDYVYAGLQDTMAQNLLKLRNERGLSRRDLAHMADISEQTLYGLEKGTSPRSFSVNVCKKLAKAFDMDLEDFVEDILLGHSDNSVPGNSILAMDLTRTYPYNLIGVIYGDDISPLNVSLLGVQEAVGNLPDKEREVIRCRYEDRLTTAQTVKRLGKSRDYVVSNETDALFRLRLPRIKKLTEAVAPEDIEKLKEEVRCLKESNNVLREMLMQAKVTLDEDFESDSLGEDSEENSRLIPIEQLCLSNRAYNGLKRNGISTTDDLVGFTPDDLRKMRGFGEKSLLDVRSRLAEIGLRLKDDE